MKELLLVAFGGALGAVARWAMTSAIAHHGGGRGFPWGTFAVNVLGCLLAGLLVAWAERQSGLAPHTRLFLLTGVLGGFTTFSAFGVETVALLKRGDTATAVAYVLASVLVGLAVLWLASAWVRR